MAEVKVDDLIADFQREIGQLAGQVIILKREHAAELAEKDGLITSLTQEVERLQEDAQVARIEAASEADRNQPADPEEYGNSVEPTRVLPRPKKR